MGWRLPFAMEVLHRAGAIGGVTQRAVRSILMNPVRSELRPSYLCGRRRSRGLHAACPVTGKI